MRARIEQVMDAALPVLGGEMGDETVLSMLNALCRGAVLLKLAPRLETLGIDPASRKAIADKVGAANKLFKYIYALRLPGKRLKAKNERPPIWTS